MYNKHSVEVRGDGVSVKFQTSGAFARKRWIRSRTFRHSATEQLFKVNQLRDKAIDVIA